MEKKNFIQIDFHQLIPGDSLLVVRSWADLSLCLCGEKNLKKNCGN